MIELDIPIHVVQLIITEESLLQMGSTMHKLPAVIPYVCTYPEQEDWILRMTQHRTLCALIRRGTRGQGPGMNIV